MAKQTEQVTAQIDLLGVQTEHEGVKKDLTTEQTLTQKNQTVHLAKQTDHLNAQIDQVTAQTSLIAAQTEHENVKKSLTSEQVNKV